eukprot:763870-Hanusia_phi.AAC.3
MSSALRTWQGSVDSGERKSATRESQRKVWRWKASRQRDGDKTRSKSSGAKEAAWNAGLKVNLLRTMSTMIEYEQAVSSRGRGAGGCREVRSRAVAEEEERGKAEKEEGGGSVVGMQHEGGISPEDGFMGGRG